MGFRFQKRIKIFPGLRINLSKSGVSTSVGVPGARMTFGNGKTRTTVGLQGTGLSHTTITSDNVPRQVDLIATGSQEIAMPTGRKSWLSLLWSITVKIGTVFIIASVAVMGLFAAFMLSSKKMRRKRVD